MFAREGYILIGLAAVFAVVLAIVAFQLAIYWRLPLLVLAGLVLAFTLYFFRDPERTPPDDLEDGRVVLSPADGKIVVVEHEVHEPLYLKGPAKQISIFLSPLDVHVNRIPTDGVIEYVNYVAGDYLVAWHPKASELNERSEIGLRHASGAAILFKQIAGAVARRIVFNVSQGDTVKAGERFGIVKFGSRMDVLMPLETDLEVEVGDRVTAGISVLARLPQEISPPEDTLGTVEADRSPQLD